MEETTMMLADFIHNLKYEDLPVEVIEKAKDLILDQFGVQLACSTKPWSQATYRLVKEWGGKAESTVVNYGDKIPAVNAAFANGAFGHGFEIDDSLRRATIHPGSVVVSAALSMGERERISGTHFILAVVIGFEVLGRIALATAPKLMVRGHHPTCTIGTFAAAAMTSKILNFDRVTLINALSIAGGYSSGLVVSGGGGDLKRIYGGLAASGGIKAALLAEKGITGPSDVLEGRLGFCHAFSDSVRLEEVTAELGKVYRLMEIRYKYHAADGHVHPMIDAAADIAREHKIDPDNIAEILIGTNKYIASRSIVSVSHPRDAITAQFSGAFSVALRLIKGSNGLNDYTDENFQNPRITNLASKAKVVIDDEVERDFPRVRAATVTIRMKDGSLYSKKAEDLRMLSREERENKFRSLSTVVISPAKAEQLLKITRGMEGVTDVSSLSKLLIP
ncbi:MAG: MmgE/PrpD family protein [Thermodesulfobacteriota bacterium]|nr:MmgE/PrpD family protein [Thermodesulfobacteriota bacterium]